MHPLPNVRSIVYWFLTVAFFLGTMIMLVVYTPTEASMGIVQKIFYVHLPVAIGTFIAAFTVAVASAGYLWQRSLWWDDLASAAGKVAVLFCTTLLVTGILWGRAAWGQWWTWSPRLTFSLVLLLLYVVYVMIRPTIESPRRRAVVSAVYGVAAFLDVPLVYFSVKLMPDIHPQSIALAPAMKITLLLWFIPVMMLLFGLIRGRYLLNRRERAMCEQTHEEPSHGPVSLGEREVLN